MLTHSHKKVLDGLWSNEITCQIEALQNLNTTLTLGQNVHLGKIAGYIPVIAYILTKHSKYARKFVATNDQSKYLPQKKATATSTNRKKREKERARQKKTKGEAEMEVEEETEAEESGERRGGVSAALRKKLTKKDESLLLGGLEGVDGNEEAVAKLAVLSFRAINNMIEIETSVIKYLLAPQKQPKPPSHLRAEGLQKRGLSSTNASNSVSVSLSSRSQPSVQTPGTATDGAQRSKADLKVHMFSIAKLACLYISVDFLNLELADEALKLLNSICQTKNRFFVKKVIQEGGIISHVVLFKHFSVLLKQRASENLKLMVSVVLAQPVETASSASSLLAAHPALVGRRAGLKRKLKPRLDNEIAEKLLDLFKFEYFIDLLKSCESVMSESVLDDCIAIYANIVHALAGSNMSHRVSSEREVLTPSESSLQLQAEKLSTMFDEKILKVLLSLLTDSKRKLNYELLQNGFTLLRLIDAFRALTTVSTLDADSIKSQLQISQRLMKHGVLVFVAEYVRKCVTNMKERFRSFKFRTRLTAVEAQIELSYPFEEEEIGDVEVSVVISFLDSLLPLPTEFVESLAEVASLKKVSETFTALAESYEGHAVNDDEKEEQIEPSEEQETVSDRNHLRWNCLFCTFENSCDTPNCAMCQNLCPEVQHQIAFLLQYFSHEEAKRKTGVDKNSKQKAKQSKRLKLKSARRKESSTKSTSASMASNSGSTAFDSVLRYIDLSETATLLETGSSILGIVVQLIPLVCTSFSFKKSADKQSHSKLEASPTTELTYGRWFEITRLLQMLTKLTLILPLSVLEKHLGKHLSRLLPLTTIFKSLSDELERLQNLSAPLGKASKSCIRGLKASLLLLVSMALKFERGWKSPAERRTQPKLGTFSTSREFFANFSAVEKVGLCASNIHKKLQASSAEAILLQDLKTIQELAATVLRSSSSLQQKPGKRIGKNEDSEWLETLVGEFEELAESRRVELVKQVSGEGSGSSDSPVGKKRKRMGPRPDKRPVQRESLSTMASMKPQISFGFLNALLSRHGRHKSHARQFSELFEELASKWSFKRNSSANGSSSMLHASDYSLVLEKISQCIRDPVVFSEVLCYLKGSKLLREFGKNDLELLTLEDSKAEMIRFIDELRSYVSWKWFLEVQSQFLQCSTVLDTYKLSDPTVTALLFKSLRLRFVPSKRTKALLKQCCKFLDSSSKSVTKFGFLEIRVEPLVPAALVFAQCWETLKSHLHQYSTQCFLANQKFNVKRSDPVSINGMTLLSLDEIEIGDYVYPLRSEGDACNSMEYGVVVGVFYEQQLLEVMKINEDQPVLKGVGLGCYTTFARYGVNDAFDVQVVKHWKDISKNARGAEQGRPSAKKAEASVGRFVTLAQKNGFVAVSEVAVKLESEESLSDTLRVVQVSYTVEEVSAELGKKRKVRVVETVPLGSHRFTGKRLPGPDLSIPRFLQLCKRDCLRLRKAFVELFPSVASLKSMMSKAENEMTEEEAVLRKRYQYLLKALLCSSTLGEKFIQLQSGGGRKPKECAGKVVIVLEKYFAPTLKATDHSSPGVDGEQCFLMKELSGDKKEFQLAVNRWANVDSQASHVVSIRGSEGSVLVPFCPEYGSVVDAASAQKVSRGKGKKGKSRKQKQKEKEKPLRATRGRAKGSVKLRKDREANGSQLLSIEKELSGDTEALLNYLLLTLRFHSLSELNLTEKEHESMLHLGSKNNSAVKKSLKLARVSLLSTPFLVKVKVIENTLSNIDLLYLNSSKANYHRQHKKVWVEVGEYSCYRSLSRKEIMDIDGSSSTSSGGLFSEFKSYYSLNDSNSNSNNNSADNSSVEVLTLESLKKFLKQRSMTTVELATKLKHTCEIVSTDTMFPYSHSHHLPRSKNRRKNKNKKNDSLKTIKCGQISVFSSRSMSDCFPDASRGEGMFTNISLTQDRAQKMLPVLHLNCSSLTDSTLKDAEEEEQNPYSNERMSLLDRFNIEGNSGTLEDIGASPIRVTCERVEAHGKSEWVKLSERRTKNSLSIFNHLFKDACINELVNALEPSKCSPNEILKYIFNKDRVHEFQYEVNIENKEVLSTIVSLNLNTNVIPLKGSYFKKAKIEKKRKGESRGKRRGRRERGESVEEDEEEGEMAQEQGEQRERERERESKGEARSPFEVSSTGLSKQQELWRFVDTITGSGGAENMAETSLTKILSTLKQKQRQQGKEEVEEHVVVAESNFTSLTLNNVLLESGSWYFEVEVLLPGLAQIGVCDPYFIHDDKKGIGVGDDLHSWAYDGSRRRVWNKEYRNWGGRRWKKGDVIGILVSIQPPCEKEEELDTKGEAKESISYSMFDLYVSLNGEFHEPYGLAFKNQLIAGKGLRPMITFNASFQGILRFGCPSKLTVSSKLLKYSSEKTEESAEKIEKVEEALLDTIERGFDLYRTKYNPKVFLGEKVKDVCELVENTELFQFIDVFQNFDLSAENKALPVEKRRGGKGTGEQQEPELSQWPLLIDFFSKVKQIVLGDEAYFRSCAEPTSLSLQTETFFRQLFNQNCNLFLNAVDVFPFFRVLDLESRTGRERKAKSEVVRVDWTNILPKSLRQSMLTKVTGAKTLAFDFLRDMIESSRTRPSLSVNFGNPVLPPQNFQIGVASLRNRLLNSIATEDRTRIQLTQQSGRNRGAEDSENTGEGPQLSSFDRSALVNRIREVFFAGRDIEQTIGRLRSETEQIITEEQSDEEEEEEAFLFGANDVDYEDVEISESEDEDEDDEDEEEDEDDDDEEEEEETDQSFSLQVPSDFVEGSGVEQREQETRSPTLSFQQVLMSQRRQAGEDTSSSRRLSLFRNHFHPAQQEDSPQTRRTLASQQLNSSETQLPFIYFDDVYVPPVPKQTVVISRNKALIISQAVELLDHIIEINRTLPLPAIILAEFDEERGHGQGPALEFFSMVCEEIAIGKYLDFFEVFRLRSISDGGIPWVPASKVYRLIGRIIALAIRGDLVVDLPLNRLFLKLIMSYQREKNEDRKDTLNTFSIEDIKEVDKVFYTSMMHLLSLLVRYEQAKAGAERSTKLMKSDAVVESVKSIESEISNLCLDFTYLGRNLVSNGEKLEVTGENLREYIEKLLFEIFLRSTDEPVSHICAGFEDFYSLDILCLYSVDELLELLSEVRGSLRYQWNVEDIIESIVCKHGYNKQSLQIRWLVEVLVEMDFVEKKNFLKFITGLDRLPAGGWKEMTPRLTVVRIKLTEASDQQQSSSDSGFRTRGAEGEGRDRLRKQKLPSCSTCQVYLKLPEYRSKEVLREKLLFAVNECQNYFALD